MAARRTERLLNLVFCLLHTRSYLTADRLREIIPDYRAAPSDEAFKRMLERDKEDLRELGIPLETGGYGAGDPDPGYRIARRDYELPAITLTADEAAAVGLAARVWDSAAMGAAATRAVRKLEATGVETVPLPEGLQPRVEAGESVAAVSEALQDGRRLQFDYATPTSPAPATRTVEPWGVVCWHGRWYLAGHDVDRDAPRVFRLSRVVGAPRPVGAAGAVRMPEGLDLVAMVASYDGGAGDTTGTVRVRSGRALGLRRAALSTASDGDGWDVVTVPCPDPRRLVDQVLSYGSDAVVLSPPDAVEEIRSRLAALVAGS